MNADEHRLDRERCEESFKNLYKWVNNVNYKGWDVFDGLNSTLFKKTPFYKSRLVRLAWIQFFKRSPLNLRKLVLVPKGYNAKGLGLFASGLVALGKLDEAKRLLDKLEEMICSGYSGISWGYNFDWQARAFYVPAGIFCRRFFLALTVRGFFRGLMTTSQFFGGRPTQEWLLSSTRLSLLEAFVNYSGAAVLPSA